MNQRDDLDRMLSAWLDDPYTPPAPHYLGRGAGADPAHPAATGLGQPRKVASHG